MLMNDDHGGLSISGPHVFVEVADPGMALATAVETALTSVLAGRCDLPDWLLNLPALSGRRFRVWLRAIMRSVPNAHLLEIGTGTGTTGIAAAWHSDGRVTTIDNWTDAEADGATFRAYRSLVRPPDRINHITDDFRLVDYASLSPADIFFYDGPLSSGDVTDALRVVQPGLRDQHVLIIDDWNYPPLREEALNAIADLCLPVVWSAEIRTTLDGSHPEISGESSDWHNGCFIAVIDRSRPVTLPGCAAFKVDGTSVGVVTSPAKPRLPKLSPQRLRAVLQDLESLGDNCELGLVQRSVGAEPLGLLRFAGFARPSEIRLDALIEAIERQFSGLGDPGTVQILSAGDTYPREYVVHERVFQLYYHTFKHEDEIDAPSLERQQMKALGYLLSKFFNDLEVAEKLCVWRSPVEHTQEEIERLLRALRSFGDVDLLWVGAPTPRDIEAHGQFDPGLGAARWLAPHLIKGTVFRLSPYENAGDIDYSAWYRMADAAHRLWRAGHPVDGQQKTGVPPAASARVAAT